MRSYQVTEFGKPLELKEYENPIPKGTEVLIRIIACGVCHSDIHLTDGFFDLGNGKRITLLPIEEQNYHSHLAMKLQVKFFQLERMLKILVLVIKE